MSKLVKLGAVSEETRQLQCGTEVDPLGTTFHGAQKVIAKRVTGGLYTPA